MPIGTGDHIDRMRHHRRRWMREARSHKRQGMLLAVEWNIDKARDFHNAIMLQRKQR